jgi:hypothetical protein
MNGNHQTSLAINLEARAQKSYLTLVQGSDSDWDSTLDEVLSDDQPICSTRNCEDINSQLHRFGVEASVNPGKWPAGHQEKALLLLKNYLKANPSDNLAKMHFRRSSKPIDVLRRDFIASQTE